MSDYDLDRIIKFHLSPINVSFQTMNPKLRCKMLHNRFAGDALAKVDRLYKGDVAMNGQIVLCKGLMTGMNWNTVWKNCRNMRLYCRVFQSYL